MAHEGHPSSAISQTAGQAIQQDGRHVAEYFGIFGRSLVRRSPFKRQSSSSLHTSLGTIDPESGLVPVTHLAIVEQDEPAPLGFQKILTTPGGYTANLRSGSTRMPIYLCYKRGWDTPAIEHVNVGHSSKPGGYRLINKTHSGRNGALCENGHDQQCIAFIESAANLIHQFVVSGVSVINHPHEKPPPGYEMCEQPLNTHPGHMSKMSYFQPKTNDMRLCYLRSKCHREIIYYEPAMLHEFVHPGIPRHIRGQIRQVANFALPEGCSVESCPVLSRAPMFFNPFVFTSDVGALTYGYALSFYENVPIEALTAQELQELALDSRVDHSNFTVLENKALVILSRFPYHKQFQKILIHLRHLCNNQHGPIEPWVYQIMCQLPMPTIEHPLIRYNLSPRYQTIFPLIDAQPFPCSHLRSFQYLIAKLSPKSIMQLFISVLAERKILFHAQNRTALILVADAVRKMIHPLNWAMAYIPYLPPSFATALQAPQAYIMGIESNLFEQLPEYYSEIPDFSTEETVIVEIDFGRVNDKSGRVKELLDKVPKDTYEMMLKRLTAWKSHSSDIFIRDHVEFDDLDSPEEIPSAVIENPALPPSQRQVDLANREVQLQDIFYTFMVSLLKGYTNCLRFIPPKDIIANESLGGSSLTDIFDEKLFYHKDGRLWQSFLKAVPIVERMHFTAFINASIGNSSALFPATVSLKSHNPSSRRKNHSKNKASISSSQSFEHHRRMIQTIRANPNQTVDGDLVSEETFHPTFLRDLAFFDDSCSRFDDTLEKYTASANYLDPCFLHHRLYKVKLRRQRSPCGSFKPTLIDVDPLPLTDEQYRLFSKIPAQEQANASLSDDEILSNSPSSPLSTSRRHPLASSEYERPTYLSIYPYVIVALAKQFGDSITVASLSLDQVVEEPEPTSRQRVSGSLRERRRSMATSESLANSLNEKDDLFGSSSLNEVRATYSLLRVDPPRYIPLSLRFDHDTRWWYSLTRDVFVNNDPARCDQINDPSIAFNQHHAYAVWFLQLPFLSHHLHVHSVLRFERLSAARQRSVGPDGNHLRLVYQLIWACVDFLAKTKSPPRSSQYLSRDSANSLAIFHLAARYGSYRAVDKVYRLNDVERVANLQRRFFTDFSRLRKDYIRHMRYALLNAKNPARALLHTAADRSQRYPTKTDIDRIFHVVPKGVTSIPSSNTDVSSEPTTINERPHNGDDVDSVLLNSSFTVGDDDQDTKPNGNPVVGAENPLFVDKKGTTGVVAAEISPRRSSEHVFATPKQGAPPLPNPSATAPALTRTPERKSGRFAAMSKSIAMKASPLLAVTKMLPSNMRMADNEAGSIRSSSTSTFEPNELPRTPIAWSDQKAGTLASIGRSATVQSLNAPPSTPTTQTWSKWSSLGKKFVEKMTPNASINNLSDTSRQYPSQASLQHNNSVHSNSVNNNNHDTVSIQSGGSSSANNSAVRVPMVEDNFFPTSLVNAVFGKVLEDICEDHDGKSVSRHPSLMSSDFATVIASESNTTIVNMPSPTNSSVASVFDKRNPLSSFPERCQITICSFINCGNCMAPQYAEQVSASASVWDYLYKNFCYHCLNSDGRDMNPMIEFDIAYTTEKSESDDDTDIVDDYPDLKRNSVASLRRYNSDSALNEICGFKKYLLQEGDKSRRANFDQRNFGADSNLQFASASKHAGSTESAKKCAAPRVVFKRRRGAVRLIQPSELRSFLESQELSKDPDLFFDPALPVKNPVLFWNAIYHATQNGLPTLLPGQLIRPHIKRLPWTPHGCQGDDLDPVASVLGDVDLVALRLASRVKLLWYPIDFACPTLDMLVTQISPLHGTLRWPPMPSRYVDAIVVERASKYARLKPELKFISQACAAQPPDDVKIPQCALAHDRGLGIDCGCPPCLFDAMLDRLTDARCRYPEILKKQSFSHVILFLFMTLRGSEDFDLNWFILQYRKAIDRRDLQMLRIDQLLFFHRFLRYMKQTARPSTPGQCLNWLEY